MGIPSPIAGGTTELLSFSAGISSRGLVLAVAECVGETSHCSAENKPRHVNKLDLKIRSPMCSKYYF